MFDTLRFYELRRYAAAVLFPNRCPFCGELIPARDYYCETCRRYLPYVYGRIEPPENISRILAVCWYSRRARGAVLSLKYGGLIYSADAFALMMSEKLRTDDNGADVLVPVPSGFLSIRNRGFSTARVICERIALRLGIPMSDAVGAADDKAEQKMLSAKGRRENAMKSFFVKDKLIEEIKGRRVVLIDDVSTTGSTLSAIAKKLLDAGAADVSACVFAQTAKCAHAGTARIKISKKRRISLKYGKASDERDMR